MSKWLSKEHRFVGSILCKEGSRPAISILRTDLKLCVYSPISKPTYEGLPVKVEGQIEGWRFQAERCSGNIAHDIVDSFNTLADMLKLTDLEKNHFQIAHKEMLWQEINYSPEIITFETSILSARTPDEWGITFYPESNNRVLYKLIHEVPVLSAPELPELFSFRDDCLYFNNKAKWSINKLQQRIGIITSSLALFVGAPVNYNLFIGRHDKKVKCIQFHLLPEHDCLKCYSAWNGHATLRDKSSKLFFSTAFCEKIDGLYIKQKQRRTLVILDYFKLLYTTPYPETKLAFSFMLMEALAKCYGLSLSNSKSNVMKNLLRKVKDALCSKSFILLGNHFNHPIGGATFDDYFKKAVDVANINSTPEFDYDPALLKELARWHRNQVFHGSLFKNIKAIEDKYNTLPEYYKKNLPVIMQAVTSILGAHFILGLDFNLMSARKREMKP